jgi:hypothetical protein
VADWTVDEWILALTAAVLAVGVVAAVGGVLAAKYARPAWKASRAKPNLRIEIRQGPGDWFDIRLTNAGEGPAHDWIVTLTIPVKPGGGGRLISADEVYRGGRYAQGWSDRMTSAGWTGTWQSTGASDAIGPGLHREQTFRPSTSAVRAEVDFVIQATGMDQRSGQFTVPEP